MYRKGVDVPPAIPINLVVDTGADSTMIRDSLLLSLGLTVPTGWADVLTSESRGRGEKCPVFDVEIEIKNPVLQKHWRIPAMEVLARPLNNVSTDGMLGRDVLRQGILHYDGPQDHFTIDYP